MAIKKRNEAHEARKFGLILGAILLLVAGHSIWRGRMLAAGACGGLGILFAAAPFLAAGAWLAFFRQWMRLAEGISWVMTRVILSVFYFGVLTPVALVLRVLGKRPLDLAFKDGRPSYWVEKSQPELTVERYKKQY